MCRIAADRWKTEAGRTVTNRNGIIDGFWPTIAVRFACYSLRGLSPVMPQPYEPRNDIVQSW